MSTRTSKGTRARRRDARLEGRTRPHPSIWRRYSFAWITGGFFLVSLVGHWVFGWFAYVDDQSALGEPVAVAGYLIEMTRDTLENWQSEFLQLLWQVGGLALLLYVGSPQSKEGDDRMEAKVDEILRRVAPADAEKILLEIDEDYAGRHTDAQHLARQEPRR
ncbi:MAG: DUF6766 family protein [Bauldia sp.]